MIFRCVFGGAAFAAVITGATAAVSHPGHSVQFVDGHSHGLEFVAIAAVALACLGLIGYFARRGAR